MTRRTRDDWLVLGLSRLAEAGPHGVRLAPLCAAAGATRGSFYHHFADHRAFLDALLDYWRDLADPELLDFAEDLDDLPPLTALTAFIDPGVEMAIRRLAAVDPGAAAALAPVDAARIDWLEGRYAAEGRADPRASAEAAHAAFVGLQHLYPEWDKARLSSVERALNPPHA